MKLKLILAAVLTTAVASMQATLAQGFPTKPLKIVVPNAAAGAADITARTVAQAIGGPLGQQVVVENKPSAGGIVAGEQVARADADGHTLLLISSGTAVSAALFNKLPFDTVKDFTPVSLLATFDLAIVVSETGRFKTLADVLAYARANPGKLNIGTPQVGTTQNLAAELFKTSAGIEGQIVPFNGTPPVITALRAGELDIAVDILGPLMGQINSKAIRPVAVLSGQRNANLADVPAAREAGGSLANFNVTSWNGLAVPAKTPRDTVMRLNKEINAALSQPDVKKRLADLNLLAGGSTPEAAAAQLGTDIQRWAGVIERAKIQKQ
jgi:tripartite-type tricarboxylate transporter receptor subunit TctC